jgi:hypothetical protein
MAPFHGMDKYLSMQRFRGGGGGGDKECEGIFKKENEERVNELFT